MPLQIAHAIDSHVHSWSLGRIPAVLKGAEDARPDLFATFSAEQLVAKSNREGLTGIILVQACDPNDDSEQEARDFIQAYERYDAVKGVIIGVDLLNSANTVAMLERLGRHPAICGGRMIAPENKGVGILSCPEAITTALALAERGLSLDVLIRSQNLGQLDEALAFVQSISAQSNLAMIGDHLLKPVNLGKAPPSKDWLDILRELARCEHFYLKLSGLAGNAGMDTPSEDFYPYLDAAFSALGAERLLFGSDHPVSFGQGQAINHLLNWFEARGISSHDQEHIFANTARRAYRLRA